MNNAKAVVIVAGIFLYQAGVLISTDCADGSIAMASVVRLFDYRPLAPAVLLLAAICGLVAVFWRNLSDKIRAQLAVPQWVVLFVFAAAAIGAAARNSYADDVLRCFGFISADQIFLTGIFLMYSIAAMSGEIGW